MPALVGEVAQSGTDSALPPYHLGFASLDREAEIDSLLVRGDVPAWLNGTLLRNGPCKFEVGDRSYNHWFDGLAMLHRFTFADGQISYANRFVRGHTFCDAERRGRISYAEFATDPCRTLFGKIAALFTSRLTDNCNINVSEFAGQVVALEEPALPIRFDPTTLETLGVYGYSDQIQGQISTAHPTATPRASATITICCSLGGRAPIACSASIRSRPTRGHRRAGR